jgi:CubicO group peptidase (beta-lactamase class C family)
MKMKLRPGSPQEAGMSEERIRRIVGLAEGWAASGNHRALVVLAARRGAIVLHEAFGRLTPDADSPPVQLDTIFPLASLTKVITATAVMILVEDGILGLNRPVWWYIPEFVGEGKDLVMVHHLLTHTSGLRNEEVTAHIETKRETVQIPPHEETQHPLVQEWVWPLYDAPLWKPPGAEMSYCTWNYELLGEIVRRVSGTSLVDFAADTLFEPVGIHDTAFIVPQPARRRVVKRGLDTEDGRLWATWKLEETPWAGGGVCSTVLDMAKFGQMFLNGGRYGDARILSYASVAEMTRNQIPGTTSTYWDEVFPEACWGLGWNIVGNKTFAGSLWSPKTFTHGGTGGIRLWIDPVNEIVGVFFSVMSYEHERFTGQETLRTADHRCLCSEDLFINAVTAAVIDG